MSVRIVARYAMTNMKDASKERFDTALAGHIAA